MPDSKLVRIDANKKTEFSSIFTTISQLTFISALALLSACGGGSSGSANSDSPQAVTVSIQGAANKGIISGGLVSGYTIVDGVRSTDAIATAITDENGSYNIELPSSYASEPLVIEITADANTIMRCDIASGCGTGIGFGDDYDVDESQFVLTALLPVASGPNVSVNVTTLTTVAAALAFDAFTPGAPAEFVADAISSANSQLADRFGFSGDITAIPVVDLTNPEAVASSAASNAAAVEYAAINAAIVSAMQADDVSGIPLSIEDAIDNFVTNFAANGIPDNSVDSSITDLGDILSDAGNILAEVSSSLSDAGLSDAVADITALETNVQMDELSANNQPASDDGDQGTASETASEQALVQIKAFVNQLRDLGTVIELSSVGDGDSQSTVGAVLNNFEVQAKAADLASSDDVAAAADAVALVNRAIFEVYDRNFNLATGELRLGGTANDVSNAQISADGDPSDWSGVASTITDPTGDQGGSSAKDITRVSVAQSGNQMALLLQTASDLVFPHTPEENGSMYEVTVVIYPDSSCNEDFIGGYSAFDYRSANNSLVIQQLNYFNANGNVVGNPVMTMVSAENSMEIIFNTPVQTGYFSISASVASLADVTTVHDETGEQGCFILPGTQPESLIQSLPASDSFKGITVDVADVNGQLVLSVDDAIDVGGFGGVDANLQYTLNNVAISKVCETADPVTVEGGLFDDLQNCTLDATIDLAVDGSVDAGNIVMTLSEGSVLGERSGTETEMINAAAGNGDNIEKVLTENLELTGVTLDVSANISQSDTGQPGGPMQFIGNLSFSLPAAQLTSERIIRYFRYPGGTSGISISYTDSYQVGLFELILSGDFSNQTAAFTAIFSISANASGVDFTEMFDPSSGPFVFVPTRTLGETGSEFIDVTMSLLFAANLAGISLPGDEVTFDFTATRTGLDQAEVSVEVHFPGNQITIEADFSNLQEKAAEAIFTITNQDSALLTVVWNDMPGDSRDDFSGSLTRDGIEYGSIDIVDGIALVQYYDGDEIEFESLY